LRSHAGQAQLLLRTASWKMATTDADAAMQLQVLLTNAVPLICSSLHSKFSIRGDYAKRQIHLTA